jgi:type III secretion system chaperone SycN
MSADIAVREFGRSLGIPGLGFNQNGVVRLNFERTGSLSIEHDDKGTMLYLARPVDRFKAGALERALGLCHFERIDRLRPGAGLTGDGALVFWVRLEAADLSVLQEAFDLLRRLHDRAAG